MTEPEDPEESIGVGTTAHKSRLELYTKLGRQLPAEITDLNRTRSLSIISRMSRIQRKVTHRN